MLFTDWYKENKKSYKNCEFTIADEEHRIILDDRICYLSLRTKEYNQAWKKAVKGKEIKEVKYLPKGVLVIVK